MKFSTLLFCGVATMLPVFLLPANQALAQPVSVAAAQPGSQNNSVASGLAKVLGDQGKMNVRVQSYGGEGVYLPLLNNGEVDVAPITSPQVIDALEGIGPFAGKAQTQLRSLGVISPIKAGLFVRKDSPIKSIKDIKGKRIVYGLSAHPSLARVLDGMLANAGLSIDDMVKVSVPTVVRGIDEFVAGNVDVGFFALTGGKLQEGDASVGGLRFLSLLDSPEADASMRKVVPTAYLSEAKPAPGQVGVLEPIKVMSYDYLVMVSTSVSEDLAYRMTKTLWDNEKAMMEAAPATREFAQKSMYKDLAPIQYHPGAIKFFKEVKATMTR
jgi:TRAP transporter TAXI family solute receptor